MPHHVFHHQDRALAGANAIFELDAVTAACVAVRASTFQAVGGFDEGYINGLEDIDLCLRIREAGQRVVYRGDATIVHHEGASRGKGKQLWATPARAAAMRSNDLRFVAAWGAKLDQDDELAAELWDAALENRPPSRVVESGEVVICGQPGGIGPAADEARALLGTLHAHGHLPSAVDWPVPIVVPRLQGRAARLLTEARRRAPVANAPWLLVPCGERDQHQFYGPTVVRLAAPRAGGGRPPPPAGSCAGPRVARAVSGPPSASPRVRDASRPTTAGGFGPPGW